MSDACYNAGSSQSTGNYDKESQNHDNQLQDDGKQSQNNDTKSPNRKQSEHSEKMGLSVEVIKEEIVVNLDPTNHYSEDQYQLQDYLNISCTLCKQTFPNVADLMQHRLTHIYYNNGPGDQDYNYHSIFDSYGTANPLKNIDETDPLAEEHPPSPPPKKVPDSEKPFCCPICQKRLSNRSSFSRHTKAHTSTETFPCDICQKVFTRKCHLETHKKLHSGIKPFECQICLKLFSQKSYLKDHQKTHKSEKKYSCTICFKRFKSNSAFRTHEAIVHNGVRKFKCTYENCDKAFTRKAQWQLHERIHNGIKPFQCTVCLRNFARNCTLQEHLLTHSDIKPFYCEMCNRQYARKSQLVLHLRVHNNVKPFSCDICKRSYTLQSSLRYHRKTHETENAPFDSEGSSSRQVKTRSIKKEKSSKKDKKRSKNKKEKPKKWGTLFEANVFICDICGEQYDKKKKIRKHLKRLHTQLFT